MSSSSPPTNSSGDDDDDDKKKNHKPKKILNDPADAVSEMVRGLLLQFPNRFVKLQHHHVLLHRPALSSSSSFSFVKCISGGGSGHEPSHAGWLGTGMLRGAVLGGMFASPSVSAIVSAIHALSTTNNNTTKEDETNEILLIVKNYTGDRLNFGMACELVNNTSTASKKTNNKKNIRVEMVVVADDCAVPRSKGITGARGVAGTVLVHKIAGAAADVLRCNLEAVAALAREACRRVKSLGVALDAVTVPGADRRNDRLLDSDGKMELGLGIHGEAGMRQVDVMKADELVKEMLSTMQQYGRQVLVDDDDDDEVVVPLMQPNDELCLLVNNLGGTSNFEMSILANAAVRELETTYQCRITRLLVGSYMTSFDMHGASLTVLNLTGAPKALVQCLDAPTDAPAWIPCDVFVRNEKDDDDEPSRPSLTELQVQLPEEDSSSLESASSMLTAPVEMETWKNEELLSEYIRAATDALVQAEPVLTKYDTIVGDGDCGITMKRGALYVAEQLDKGALRLNHPSLLFRDVAQAVSASMGGTSGVLLELMFRKMSSSVMLQQQHRDSGSGGGGITEETLCDAFAKGVEAVSFYGGATVGARTMLDAMVPAARELRGSKSLKVAANKAREGANATADMKLATAGRSNYLSEETLVGTPDPGAVAVAVVLEALASVAES